MKADEPVICFGQQPCGIFPRRFLWAKILTARRLQSEIGGRIVFFFHDSDHDPRETQAELCELKTGEKQRINFAFKNKLQKKYTPLYAKKIVEGWQCDVARQLPKFAPREVVEIFESISADTVADFCLKMYSKMGLLEGMEVVRSSDAELRASACCVDDYFVDVEYEGEWVRARLKGESELQLHRGGSHYIQLSDCSWGPEQISPTRDTRLRWMQSVVHCTHYIAGAGELQYLNMEETPEITFVARDEISDSAAAYIPNAL